MQKYVQLTVHSQPSHTSNKFNFPFGYQHVHVSFLFKNVKNVPCYVFKRQRCQRLSVQTTDTVQT